MKLKIKHFLVDVHSKREKKAIRCSPFSAGVGAVDFSTAFDASCSRIAVTTKPFEWMRLWRRFWKGPPRTALAGFVLVFACLVLLPGLTSLSHSSFGFPALILLTILLALAWVTTGALNVNTSKKNLGHKDLKKYLGNQMLQCYGLSTRPNFSVENNS